MSKNIKIMLLVSLIFLIIGNVTYAGFFPVYEYVEVNLNNYKNNIITIKDGSGKILETNEKGKIRLEDGTGFSGSLIVSKGEKIVIDNLYSAAQDVDKDYIKTILIEITNNLGNTDIIKCEFELRETKYYYFNYDCNSGKVEPYDVNNTEELTKVSFLKEHKDIIIIALILVTVLISVFIIRKKEK